MTKVIKVAILLSVTSLLHACATTTLASDNVTQDDGAFETLVNDGQRHWNAGEYQKASDAYQQALALQDRYDLRKALGELALAMHRFDLARSYLEPLLRANPSDVDLRESLAITLLKQQHITQAHLQFSAINNLDSERPLTLNYLGVIHDLSGDHATAAAYYKRALDLQPDNATFNNNLGYSKLMLGEFSDAEHWFSRALEQNPDEAERITNNLAIAYARQGLYKKAISLLSATGDNPVALNNVGYVALLNGDYQNAINYLERAIELSPAYYARAAANLKRAKRQLAEGEADS